MFKTYADTIDLYEMFGVYVVKGGLREILAIPPIKSVPQNDWYEEDGIEVDYTALRLSAREINLNFAISDVDLYGDFLQFLSTSVYRTFVFGFSELAYNLRFVAEYSFTTEKGLGLFTLRFAEDAGAVPQYGVMPQERQIQDSEWGIDNMRLADFGKVLKGAEGGILSKPNLKQNLQQSFQHQNGGTYDKHYAKNKSREVRIPLLFYGDDFAKMYSQYCALFTCITAPQEHYLKTPYINRPLPFYYKACSVEDYEIQGGFYMLKISLTLELVDGGSKVDLVLGGHQTSTNSDYFVTHDEQYIKIER